MQEIISVPEFIRICSYQNSTKANLFAANHQEENMLFNMPKYCHKNPQQTKQGNSEKLLTNVDNKTM